LTPGAQDDNKLARYGQAFKDRAVARLLPPESASPEAVSSEIGVSAATLQRWRSDKLAEPGAAVRRTWTAAARLEAVITTAAMDEASRNAWCREHGVFTQQLQQWRAHAMHSLADGDSPPAASRQAQIERHSDRKRIKELERELRRKERALAETAALLVLSKKVEAIFNKAEDE
jgi:transposase